MGAVNPHFPALYDPFALSGSSLTKKFLAIMILNGVEYR
jgi:hypothetical protein